MQPFPTPLCPAEALAFPGSHHMAPDLLFYPVFNEAEALTGVSNREIIHPSTQYRVDQLNNSTHWLRSVATEHVLELSQQRRSFLELWRIIGLPFAPSTRDATKVEPQEAKALASAEICDSTLLFIDFNL